MKCRTPVLFVLGALVSILPTLRGMAAERDLFDDAPWYIGLGVGHVGYEGDAPVQDDFLVGLRLGYDIHEFFGIELGFDYIPNLDATVYDPADTRFRLSSDTSAMRFSLDALFHLRNTENLHWDPYLAIGGSWFRYEDSLKDGKDIVGLHAGAGLFYHFNDSWAIRGDFRTVIEGETDDFSTLLFFGVNYRWGATIPAKYTLAGGELDSDGDGLSDSYEVQIGTNPFDPDTDQDRLSDGEEVLTYKTDPLNPDTDWDGLKDGAEVMAYSTNPLDPDTDDGGVTDGHEVIEDGTNPLDPSDDLQLFTLNIEFDYDRATIRSADYEELNVVAKVLQRDPGATARIEGHADKRPTSKRKYNQKLSERRAAAVVDYLVDVGGIERSRLTSKGFGFDRPMAPNDTEANMQKNRRTDVYIRKSDQQTIAPSSEIIDMGTLEEAN